MLLWSYIVLGPSKMDYETSGPHPRHQNIYRIAHHILCFLKIHVKSLFFGEFESLILQVATLKMKYSYGKSN